MVFDHVNKYLYAEGVSAIFQLGRVVMPIFGFVLARQQDSCKNLP
jgi:hypothetical protein